MSLNPPAHDASAHEPNMTLPNRPLGIWSATALVVGSMIGSGAFLLPAALAPYGAASLLGWGITLAGAVLLALTFARLSMRWPQTGGPYVYARNAFGELPGFVIAWSYWISIWCATAAIAVAFAGSMGALFPVLTATPLRAASCALGALWLCSAINLTGVREAGRVQLLTTVLKLLPLLLFGGIALWFVDTSRFTPFNPTEQSLPAVANATVALTLWALLGLEAATVPAGSRLPGTSSTPAGRVRLTTVECARRPGTSPVRRWGAQAPSSVRVTVAGLPSITSSGSTVIAGLMAQERLPAGGRGASDGGWGRGKREVSRGSSSPLCAKA